MNAIDDNVVNPPAKPVIQKVRWLIVVFIRNATYPATNTPNWFTRNTPKESVGRTSINCQRSRDPRIPPSATSNICKRITFPAESLVALLSL